MRSTFPDTLKPKFNLWHLLAGWMSVMDRYLVAEMIMPFLFGVGAFSSVGIAVGALFELVRRVTESGLPFSIAAEVFALQLPYFISLALPMSTLLATLMAYSRFSSDSELTALRSCGVSIYRLVVPAVLCSLLVTGITFVFNELVVPAANYRAAITLEKALNRERPTFRQENILYQEFQDEMVGGRKVDRLSRLFYARQFDGQQMRGLTILDFSQEGLNQIVTAQAATWNPQESTWDFFDGTVYVVDPGGSYRSIARFEQQKLSLPRTPLDLAERGRDYGEMNIVQAQEQLKLIESSGDEQKIRKLKVRIQQKYSFPFVCVVFGLVGATLGTRPQRRTSKATGFGISILIIFLYYLAGFICSSLGILGALSPFMAAWLPTFFGLGAGGLLLVRIAR